MQVGGEIFSGGFRPSDGGVGGRHPDPEIRGGHFGLKIRGGFLPRSTTVFS